MYNTEQMITIRCHIAYIRIVETVGQGSQASLPAHRQIRTRTLSPKIGGETEEVEFTGLINPIPSDGVQGSLWGLSQALLARYRAIIPLVEAQGTGGAYLDLSGLESLYEKFARPGTGKRTGAGMCDPAGSAKKPVLRAAETGNGILSGTTPDCGTAASTSVGPTRTGSRCRDHTGGPGTR